VRVRFELLTHTSRVVRIQRPPHSVVVFCLPHVLVFRQRCQLFVADCSARDGGTSSGLASHARLPFLSPFFLSSFFFDRRHANSARVRCFRTKCPGEKAVRVAGKFLGGYARLPVLCAAEAGVALHLMWSVCAQIVANWSLFHLAVSPVDWSFGDFVGMVRQFVPEAMRALQSMRTRVAKYSVCLFARWLAGSPASLGSNNGGAAPQSRPVCLHVGMPQHSSAPSRRTPTRTHHRRFAPMHTHTHVTCIPTHVHAPIPTPNPD
jgi:hypothetical protein